MKLFVTGGAGFIGSNFIRYMLNQYPDAVITNFDALTYAANPLTVLDADNQHNYHFIQGDVRYRRDVEQAMGGDIDVVVHFAAESHVDRSIASPEPFVHTNVCGTQTLLEASRNVGVKRYIQVSTDEVYGSLDADAPAFTERSPLNPNSPYAASKAAADLVVRAYHQTFGLHTNVTRCSNNYGPYQHPEKLVPTMIVNALGNRSLPIYGDGLQIRDWLHVLDHCRALDLVIHYGQPGETYNVGGNNERTNLHVVKTILRYLNKPSSLIQHIEDRLGHDRRYAIDASKIRTKLGWSPKQTFEVGLAETVEWYVKHQHWLRPFQASLTEEGGNHI